MTIIGVFLLTSLLFLLPVVSFLQLKEIAVIPVQLNPVLNHMVCVVEEKLLGFFFLVGSHFLNEGLISRVIPSVLIVILDLWFRNFKHSSSQEGNHVVCFQTV